MVGSAMEEEDEIINEEEKISKRNSSRQDAVITK
jgi:hypothetical protein